MYVIVYTFTYIHTYIHAYIHAYMHTYMHACIHTCIHTYIHAYMHTGIHTCIHANTWEWLMDQRASLHACTRNCLVSHVKLYLAACLATIEVCWMDGWQGGWRWIRRPGGRNKSLEAVRIIAGRNAPGKSPSWLVRLQGITTIEQVGVGGQHFRVWSHDRSAFCSLHALSSFDGETKNG